MTQKKLKFKSYDGFGLSGTFLKTEKKEMGAVLFVHGITSSRDELGFHSDYAEFLSENGISSFRFDYRYHGGAEDGNTELQNLSLCGILNDIDAAFQKLVSLVDTKNFIIIGTSFGGGLSAYWANHNKDNGIKKVILNAPVIDYEDDVLGRNTLLKDGLLAAKGIKQLDSKGFVDSSGILFGRALINETRYVNGIQALKDLGAKVAIFHGDDDEDVPLKSSQKFKTAATQLETIKGVGHGFGVDGDEDLDFPETKEIHKKIYGRALQLIQQTI